MRRLAASLLLASACGCGDGMLPTQPSAVMPPAFPLLLQAEAARGDGQTTTRPAASGGLTVHLAPAERRAWTFPISAPGIPYRVSVTYANGRFGDQEVLTVMVDGIPVGSFQNRDTGEDNEEGWNVFVTDVAGTFTPGPGTHVLVIESAAGDGCVEIDMVTLSPM